jgi:hypothetical protein
MPRRQDAKIRKSNVIQASPDRYAPLRSTEARYLRPMSGAGVSAAIGYGEGDETESSYLLIFASWRLGVRLFRLCAKSSNLEAVTRLRVLPSDKACSLVRPLARDSGPLLSQRFLPRAPNPQSKAA